MTFLTLCLDFVFFTQIIEEDDDDEDVPYNPKNLPLGWDGKVSFNFSISLFCNI